MNGGIKHTCCIHRDCGYHTMISYAILNFACMLFFLNVHVHEYESQQVFLFSMLQLSMLIRQQLQIR